MAHTYDLDQDTLTEIRTLLSDAFEGGFGYDDWDHALGGVHVVLTAGGQLVAHGSVVQRRLIYAGRALRTGYVEGVAVRADKRRQGLGAAVMAALEDVVRGGYELGALSASQDAVAFYIACGWTRWSGATFALTPSGTVRTPEDDDAVFVLPSGTRLDPSRALTCDWRDGDLW